MNQHLLWYLGEWIVRHLSLTFGSSHVASSAYQKWPTKNFPFKAQVQLSNLRHLTHLKFESWYKVFHFVGHLSLSLPSKTVQIPAILRETSEETSNQMVRLVFRPYTQIRRTICTSVSLRASTAVSYGFTLSRHSSPSFGSQHISSNSNLS